MLYERYLRAYAEQFRKTDRNMWNYEDGCVLIGLRALYQATGDAFYFDVLNSFMERYIEPDGTIRRYVAEEYNLDYIPAGCALYTLYDETGESRYRKAIETLEEQLRHQPRTPCGSFWHKGIYPNQVWLDGLYMGLPFHAAYALRFGDAATLDDIMLQFRNARKYLYDETIEAFILHCADNMDAKTKMFEEMLAADNTQGSWAGYHRMLARNIRKSDYK